MRNFYIVNNVLYWKLLFILNGFYIVNSFYIEKSFHTVNRLKKLSALNAVSSSLY